MNSSSLNITYALLLIPVLFACTIIGQGIYKITQHKQDGIGILFFGILLLVIIIITWVFFIR